MSIISILSFRLNCATWSLVNSTHLWSVYSSLHPSGNLCSHPSILSLGHPDVRSSIHFVVH